jgi:MAF protein
MQSKSKHGSVLLSAKHLFILASSSPRRRELLSLAGFMFNTVKIDVDESPLPDEEPSPYVLRLSRSKAQAATGLVLGAPRTPLIVAADTTVADNGEILGKPPNAEAAERVLKQLRGRTHQVHTAIAVLNTANGQLEQEIASTDVPMRDYSDQEIADYIATGDPFDKAGGYAIQHPGFHPVETRTGCYANVVGLPLCHLLKILRRMEISVAQDIPFLCQSAHEYECGVFNSILRA